MENVKQKRNFKDAVKDTGSKAKAYAKKQGEKVKNYGKKYASDIRDAYDIGFARGWVESYDIPNRVGAKTAAAYGYKKGLAKRRKSDKYVAQYQRQGGKRQ